METRLLAPQTKHLLHRRPDRLRPCNSNTRNPELRYPPDRRPRHIATVHDQKHAGAFEGGGAEDRRGAAQSARLRRVPRYPADHLEWQGLWMAGLGPHEAD